LREGAGRRKPAADKQTLLADAFEAVVAAVYLDGGLGAVREVLRKVLFEQALEERVSASRSPIANPHCRNSCRVEGRQQREYRVVGESGPDHQKVFQIEVWIDGECIGNRRSSTKKEASNVRHRSALEQLERAEAKG